LPLLILLAGIAHAGIVQTIEGRIEGPVTLEEAQVKVGDKAAPWDRVIYAMLDHEGRTFGAPHAVRFANGEVWCAEIVGLAARKLSVQFGSFGKREIDVAQLASVEFAPGLPIEGNAQPGALYMEKREPVPGTLLWIDDKQLAIDSPLGVLTLPRDGAVRYTFPASAKPTTEAGDELRLIDGSILRGRIKPANGGVSLDHPVLGAVSLPVGAVRSVARHLPNVVDLTELAPASVKAVSLLGSAPLPRAVELLRFDAPRSQRANCLRAARIEPKTTALYRVPAPAGKRAMLRASVGPAPGCRGDVRVKIAASGKALFEREFAASAEAAAVSVDLPAGGEVSFEVDFGPRLQFPCAAVIADPLVVFE
jgi:hypothetical protein